MINITPFKQTDDSRCGPACIKMVLSYYGIEITEDEAAIACGWTYELGCTNEGIVKALESYGLVCYMEEESDLDAVDWWIHGCGVPVIVDWLTPQVDIDLSDMPVGHSSIVVDTNATHITLLDPEFGGNRVIRNEDFLSVWFDWKDNPMITGCSDLVLRLAIAVFPNKNKEI